PTPPPRPNRTATSRRHPRPPSPPRGTCRARRGPASSGLSEEPRLMVARMAGPVVIVSNRGPLSYAYDDAGQLVAKRGAGGIVSSLAPLVRGTGARWIAAAISDADRAAASEGLVEADDFHVRYLALPPDTYRLAYDVMSNGTLWFLHH